VTSNAISWEQLPTFFKTKSERKKNGLRLRDYVALPAALPWVLRLPKLKFVGSNAEIERLSRTLVGKRKVVGRLLHTAYFVPDSLEGFFAGQSQANLRKSSNAAKRDGYAASWQQGAELLSAVNEILIGRQSKKGEMHPAGLQKNTRVSLQEAEGVVVVSPEGAPVSVIVGMRIGGVFTLRLAIGSEHGRPRWLAFATLITEGHERGVRLILAERVWALARGDVVFQERLGFVPVNLQLSIQKDTPLLFQLVDQ